MLSVRSVTRTFGERTALDDVSFDVVPGRVTGFVGANGAGKTTTMKVIMGVLAADSGEVLWQGKPVTPEQRREFGYLPEERGLYPKMPVLDQVVFFARLHGASKAQATERATGMLGSLGLADRLGDTLETLSLGNQQRVQIAVALIHRPIALILDEPFSGLDPVALDSMAQILREEAGAQVPLLFSSHQLELVERLCDDIVVLSAGVIVAAGPANSLRAADPVRVRVTFASGTDARRTAEDLRDVTVAEADGSTALLELARGGDDESAQVALLAALAARAPVREFARTVRPLAEIFREVTR